MTDRVALGWIPVLGIALGLVAIPLSAYFVLAANMLGDSVYGGEPKLISVRLYLVSPLSMLLPALIVLLPIGYFSRNYKPWHAFLIGMVGAASILAISIFGQVNIGAILLLELAALVLFSLLCFQLGQALNRRSRHGSM